MAVGDNAPSVNNYHWLEQAGLTSVYEAGKAFASANASNLCTPACNGKRELIMEADCPSARVSG